MRKWKRAMLGILAAMLLVLPCMPAFALPKVYMRSGEDKQRIAITMDDCWKMGYVAKMLDLCAEYGFRMTFFPSGVNIREEERDIWLRMLNEGHEIGNHTHNHRKLTNLTATHTREELRFMKERLNRVLGFPYELRLVRPPYGAFGGGNGSQTARIIEEQGYPYIIMWSISETDPDKMLKMVKNGDILLYHSNKKDVEGLRKAIPILLERGFELVTVSELLELDVPRETVQPETPAQGEEESQP